MSDELIAWEKDGVVYVDRADAKGEDPIKRAMAIFADIEKTLARLGEPFAPLTWRQRLWRRIRTIFRS